jgi:iron complex outermembrane receptor protein
VKTNRIVRHLITLNTFSLIFCLHSQAQGRLTLSGSIRDSKSLPVRGATVHLLNTVYSAVTDSLGQYRLERINAGNYTIQVSAVGYATQIRDVQLDAGSKGPVDILLPAREIQLEGIVVSAEKREELLQKVPLSISAFSAGDVREYRLWNAKELSAIVPNLYSSNPGDDRNVTSIRGITTTSYDPAVSTYIDGVNQFSLDSYIPTLWDVDRIEVIRGPQGSLYGRNAMGGVINIVTRQPGDKTDGFVETSMGSYQLFRGSFGIRQPIVKKKLYVGAALLYDTRDGYYHNDYYNNSFDIQHAITGNYFLKWQVHEKLSLTLNAKQRFNRNNGAFTLVNGLDQALANPFHLSQDATAKMIDNTTNISLSAIYRGTHIDINSQTAYQRNYRYYDKPLDADFSPIDGITIINNYGRKWNTSGVWTEELRFNSNNTQNRQLNWTAGTYLFLQDNPNKQAVHFGKDAAYVGAPDQDFSVINTTKATNKGFSLFGELRYAITHSLKFIAGLRYDEENRRAQVLGEYQKDPNPMPLFDTRPDTSATVRFAAVSPRLGLTWSIRPTVNVFVMYSRGFRTGGLTPLSSDPSQPPLYPFKPEYNNTLEAGLKTSLLDNRMQLNFTIFQAYITHAQVPTLILPDAVTITRNAGRLNSKGFEVELSARPIKGLKAVMNFGYTDARYETLKLSQNGSAVDLESHRQIFTPRSTGLVMLHYEHGLGNRKIVTAFAHGEMQSLGKEYFDLANTLSQQSYVLINASCGVTFRGYSLSCWARNLGNKKYVAYAYDFGAVHLGDPRVLGLTLRANL